MTSTKTNIYILRLTGGNYYVGKSSDVETRIQEHFASTGSAWTTLHKPLSVDRIIKDVDSFDEDTWVKRYMSQKGIDKVRGGSYSTLTLTPIQIAALNHELKGVTDKCFNCGKSGHFVADCGSRPSTHTSTPKCYRCNRKGHYADNCYAKTRVYDSSSSDCYDSDDSYDSDESWD